MNQANRNANDAIDLAQTIEAGIDEFTNMLQRLRTLAMQSANGINTSDDRSALNNEANELAAEIDRIAEKTTYGGKTILNGGALLRLFMALKIPAQVTITQLKQATSNSK